MATTTEQIVDDINTATQVSLAVATEIPAVQVAVANAKTNPAHIAGQLLVAATPALDAAVATLPPNSVLAQSAKTGLAIANAVPTVEGAISAINATMAPGGETPENIAKSVVAVGTATVEVVEAAASLMSTLPAVAVALENLPTTIADTEEVLKLVAQQKMADAAANVTANQIQGAQQLVLPLGHPKLLIISNLYMGQAVDGSASSFHFNDAEFAVYLEARLKEGYEVVVNGNAFECWGSEYAQYQGKFNSNATATVAQGPKFKNCSEEMGANRFAAIKAQYPLFIGMIESGRVKFINGNHDACVRTANLIKNVVESYDLTIGNRRIHIEHGHQAEHYYAGKDQTYIGCAAFWASCCKVALHDDTLDLQSAKLLATISNPLDTSFYPRYAQQIADADGYDVVIFGHDPVLTQQLLLTKQPGKTNTVYINDGRCCADQTDSRRIDECSIEPQADGSLKITQQQRWLDDADQQKQLLRYVQQITVAADGKCSVANPNQQDIAQAAEVANMVTAVDQSLQALGKIAAAREAAGVAMAATSAGVHPVLNARVAAKTASVRLVGSVSKVSDAAFQQVAAALASHQPVTAVPAARPV